MTSSIYPSAGPARAWAGGASALALAALVGCGAGPSPEAIIERAIDVHGVEALETARVTFGFRGERFVVTRDGGWFRHERIHRADGERIRDVMTNEGSFREVDGRSVPLGAEERAALETALNSVVYFAFLPHRLRDAAVVARHLGEEILGGAPYHVVEVTFREQGGGRDWQDRFTYWFHQDEGTLDYLAYRYHVGDGGTRFRRAVNRRRVEGVLVQDYENLVLPGIEDIREYGRAYEAGSLQWVSDVELEGVRFASPPPGFPEDGESPDPAPEDSAQRAGGLSYG